MRANGIAILGAVFGILAFVFVALDWFELQVICAIAAAGLSGYAIWKHRSKLAIIGLLLGALFLVSIGVLWLIWPK